MLWFAVWGETPASQSICSFSKGPAPHRTQEGRTNRILSIPSRGAPPPVRRTGLHNQNASGFRPDCSSTARFMRV